MQISRHTMPDGSEEICKKVFDAACAKDMRSQMTEAHRVEFEKDTLVEIKQTIIDLEDPCPCGGGKKAKNCCSGRMLKRLHAERKVAEREHDSVEQL